MARDKEYDSASSTSGQSKRPPLSRQETDQASDSHQRPKGHQKQHHVGRINARVPSSKALHKHGHGHGHGHAPNKQNNNHNRRVFSPPESPHQPQDDQEPQLQHPPHPQQQHPTASSMVKAHRRSTSEVKLSRNASATALQKSLSQASLKRNQSYGEVSTRTLSSDKLRRHSAGAVHINKGKSNKKSKTTKSQVHFDLGGDAHDAQNDEDEWVDASGSNSPHLSRKGSLNSAHSSLRPTASAANSRPHTPNVPTQPVMPSPERERTHRKEYLTTRILQRTPSHGAPPQMSTESAQVNPPKFSPGSAGQETHAVGSGKEGLTSRFVDTPVSGITSEGSFYHPERSDTLRSEDLPRRHASMADLSRSQENSNRPRFMDDMDDSALVPKPARRTPGKPAETSRIQQKLNLQRASSAIEPTQAVNNVPGNLGATPLIGVGGPGYDAGNSRDPRMSKLMDRTGSEYLVVRRYQNPVARSLQRLGHLPDVGKTRRVPRVNTGGSTMSKRSLEMPVRHVRNVSLPEQRRQPSRPSASTRLNGESSFDDNDDHRLSERLSGTSLIGSDDDNGTFAILRHLWEKSTDLNASA